MADRIHGDFAAVNQSLARSRNDQKNKSHALRSELTMSAHLRETRDKHDYDRPITVTKLEPLYSIDGVEAQPCIGSGFCCKQAPCGVGLFLHGPIAPCPSLEFSEDRHWCGALKKAPPGPLKNRLVKELAIGAGCCSPLNGDRLRILQEKQDDCSDKR